MTFVEYLEMFVLKLQNLPIPCLKIPITMPGHLINEYLQTKSSRQTAKYSLQISMVAIGNFGTMKKLYADFVPMNKIAPST